MAGTYEKVGQTDFFEKLKWRKWRKRVFKYKGATTHRGQGLYHLWGIISKQLVVDTGVDVEVVGEFLKLIIISSSTII